MRGASHGADFHAERTTVQCGRAGGSSVISPREDQWPAFLRQASRRSNVAIRYGPIIRIEIQTQSSRPAIERSINYPMEHPTGILVHVGDPIPCIPILFISRSPMPRSRCIRMYEYMYVGSYMYILHVLQQ